MSDKNLKISVKSDLRDGQKLTRFVQDLHQKVEKFAKVLGNLRLGGGPPTPTGKPAPGQLTLSKQLEVDKKAMEVMGREVETLDRRFQNLGRTVQRASQNMHAVSGKGGLVDQFGRQMDPSGASSAPGAPGGRPPGGGATTPGTTPGTAWWERPVGGKGPMRRMLGQFGGASATFAIINALKNTVLGSWQRDIDWAGLAGKQQSYGGQADMGEFGARTLRGDIMPLIGAWRSQGNGGSWQLPSDLKTVANQSKGAAYAKEGGKLFSVGGIVGLATDPPGYTSNALQNVTDRGVASTVLRNSAAQVEAGARANLVQNEFIRYAQSQAATRTAFSRRHGGEFSAGTALAFNVDPQQVAPVVGAVLDVLGRTVNIAKVTRIVSEGMRMGLSNEAIQAMTRAKAQGGGDVYERILRSGMSRPMMSRAGTAAVDYASRGLVMGPAADLAGAFTYGGAGNDEFTARRRQAGLDTWNQVSTGGLDQYQATVNTALAVRQGGSMYTAGSMAKLSFQDLLRIAHQGPTEQEKASGFTKARAMELLRAEVNSSRGRLVNEGSNATPGAKAVLGAGADLWGAIQSGKNLPALSAGINQAFGLDPNAETAQALYGVEHPAQGPRAKAHGGRFEGAQSANLAGPRYMEGHGVDMQDALKVIGAASQSMDAFVRSMQATQLGANDADSARRAALGLGGVGEVMQRIASNSEKVTNVLEAVRKIVDAAVNPHIFHGDVSGNPGASFNGSSQAP